MRNVNLVVDAMGGDHAPQAILDGISEALRESNGLHFVLVGNQSQLRPLLSQSAIPPDKYSIEHTTERIEMDEKPGEALKMKPNASISLAARLAASGRGDALISAGNTGATILACSRVLKRLAGIERTALAAILPTQKTHPASTGRTIMLDVGATLHCESRHLVNFALMGTYYAREVMGIQNPRVGLLNIGEEENKGHAALVESYGILKKTCGVNFVGNIEGKDVLQGKCDVVISEGYVGNIVIKTLEGIGEITFEIGKKIWKKGLFPKVGLFLLSPILKKIKKRLDYTEYGGAPLLGFEQLVIKCHGRFNAKAIKNAISLAENSVRNELIPKMNAALKKCLEGQTASP